MVETEALKRRLPLLREEGEARGADHGPPGPDRARRQDHARQRGARLQGLQQQEEVPPADRMGGVPFIA